MIVDDGIDHGVRHGEPVEGEEDVLREFSFNHERTKKEELFINAEKNIFGCKMVKLFGTV